jgi:hypothetical protein
MSNRIKIKNPFALIERREEIKRQKITRQQTDDQNIPRTFGFYASVDRHHQTYADKFPSIGK